MISSLAFEGLLSISKFTCSIFKIFHILSLLTAHFAILTVHFPIFLCVMLIATLQSNFLNKELKFHYGVKAPSAGK